MADRTSAGVFGKLFKMLAREPKKNKALALEVWELSYSYDFDPSQMECEEALAKLGLCWKGADGEPLYGPKS